jgi:nicotinamide phosphoribosyltransferase
MSDYNPILDVDSYKSSHSVQYPPGTVGLFNYLESRGGAYDRTVFYGLQYYLKKYLSTPVTRGHVEDAAEFFKKHGVPFNKEGWKGIVNDHGGYIPLRIRALPEGLVVPTHTPLLTCESTDPKYFWVVGWFETAILRAVWYPTTVATASYFVKQAIKKNLQETADDLSGLPFKLHDFGARGVSSLESAAIGGSAHLVNFMGSDTISGILLANEYYGAEMAGFSIPAAEHSTITSWGKDHEADAYENMIAQFSKPGSIYAVVSDSYDINNAVEHIWGEQLRQKVIDGGGTLVIRPDSGDPVFMVNTIAHTLDRKFGSKLNSKGYKVLNNVRIIQGDGLNPPTIDAILKSLKVAGFSGDNVAFGMGGGLLQQVNRDTLRFAYKCSAVQVETNALARGGPDREWRDVYKDPVSDPGKKSKRGRLDVIFKNIANIHDGLRTVRYEDAGLQTAMRDVFEDGEILVNHTFEGIRERANR